MGWWNGLFEPRLAQDYAFVTSSEIAPSRLAQAFLADCRAHFDGSEGAAFKG